MDRVTIRDLRNHGGEVVDRVATGDAVRVTRAGTPVAELRPVRRDALDATTLLSRWRHLRAVDPQRFRADVDATVDQSLSTANADNFTGIPDLRVVEVPTGA